MPTWSEMQKKAIYTKDKNILVSASAGSGKTTVLIARLLNLIQQEKIEINRILAMTFTEAAASEMKKRLSKELNRALLICEDAEERAYLKKQLANVSSAYISTIHGFCLNIIKNYYYVIGLNKERISNIMDDASTASILEESMEMTFQHFISEERFLSLCTIFSSKANSNENLKQTILSLFNLANAKSDPFVFLESCRPIGPIATIQDYPEAIRTYFFDYISVQVESILQGCKEFLLFLQEEDEKKIKIIHSKIEALEKCIDYIKREDYSNFKLQFVITCAISMPTIKDNDDAKRLRTQISDLEDSVNAILFEEDTYFSISNTNIPYINTLIDVVSYFLKVYNLLKKENQCMDFSDMEHYALEILKAENGMVASLYREQFIEIMVDEFQDSNDVQDDLVKLICKDNNVFRVGDIKQSIYGFRHATPEIMRSLINNKSEKDEIIYLNSNYRSKQSIVNFNNSLFHELMNVNGFSSSFNEYDKTLCGLTSQKEGCSPVVFHILDEPFFKNIKGSFYKDGDEIKARYIANQIVQKVKQGYTFRDFVILIKTNAKAEPLRDAFEKANIPYFISMKQGFYESSAIANIITFLKTLNNPYEDLDFIAFLLSPFMQLENKDLVKARLHKKGSFYEYFKNQDGLQEFENLLAHKQEWSVSTLLNHVYSFNNYYECYTSAQEKSNLDKLYELACSYELKQHLTLEQFLDIIEQSKSAKIGEAIPIGNEENVVRVMSIHQSKGLQFPVVFLYSISNVSIMDTQGIISFDDTLKIRLNHIDPFYRYNALSLERIAINHKITKAALEEEMRLLYVATTRAQNEMHIVDFGVKGEKNPINRVEVYKKKGFTAWILQTLYHLHDTHEFYREISVESLWDEEVLPAQLKEKVNMLRYTHDYEEKVTHSPSENEILSYRPRAFSINEDYGMERGTSLHKMVEILPNTEWSIDLIDAYASEHELILNNHDKDVLLSLQKHPLFAYAQTGEVVHEFPFMIKDENSITHGFMDYVSKVENKIIMIDFKSDRNIDENILIERYKGQIDAYTHALHLLYPDKEIESFIYSFELKTMIPL